MLGLPKGKVFLVPWNEQWQEEFHKEEKRIMAEIGDIIIRVHHIGSTAIKHVSAKPIIDIAVELDHFKDGVLCVPGLERIDYHYKGTNVLPDRYYFNKGEPRTHQIHMYQTGSPYLKYQLIFRDYLNNHAWARHEYEQLKHVLSACHPSDKHTYADAKTEFIEAIIKKATGV